MGCEKCANYDEFNKSCSTLTKLSDPGECFAYMTVSDKMVSIGLCVAHYKHGEWPRDVITELEEVMKPYGTGAAADFRRAATSKGTTNWKEFEKYLRRIAESIIKRPTGQGGPKTS